MKIYLINENPSDYDSHPRVIGFVQTQEVAEAIVAKYKENYNKAKEFYEQTLAPAMLENNKLNGFPESIPKVPIRKWEAGIAMTSITEEMRNEREDIKKQNEEIAKKNARVHNDWMKAQTEYLRAFFEPVQEEEWFKRWYVVGEYHIRCNVGQLCKGDEYDFTECDEIK